MLSQAESKRLRALTRRRNRAESGLFLVEGVRVVEDLLASSIVPHMALIAPSLEDTPRGSQLARTLRAQLRTVEVTERELADHAGTDAPQGVVVVAHIPAHTLATLPVRERTVVVLMDAVQDPGNFGTIVRSADAFGAAGVIALPGTVDPWNAKAVRSAAGSSLRVPIVEAGTADAIAYLRTHDFHLLGADMHGASIDQVSIRARTALALGNEGAGLGDEIRAACDQLTAVPIVGAAESLNVGVAAGILLYMITRMRSL